MLHSSSVNQWIPTYFGEIDLFFVFLKQNRSRLQLEDVNVHKWFQVCHQKHHVRTKEKPALLGQFQTVTGILTSHYCNYIIYTCTSHKTWKIYEKSQGSWLFFPGGCIISHRQTRHRLHLKTLFLQLPDFQNIGARLVATRVPLTGVVPEWMVHGSGWFNKLHNYKK